MSDAIDVRESFLRFPAWTQHFWTWFTGKALPRQQPLIRHTWFSYLVLILAIYFAGLSLSVVAVSLRFQFWYLALLAGWILTLSAARSMILVIAHQCIHKRFSGNGKRDNLVGEMVTVLTFYQDADTFRVEHFHSHHREAVFATHEDPPVQVLLGLGFRPGMTRRRLWLQALLVFFSPAFYLRGFVDRLWCNLVKGTWRRVGFLSWAAFWLSLPIWLPHGGTVLLLAFLIPVILLAQLSALLDKLGEHAWLTQRDPRHGTRYYHVAATWGRFCGRAVPSASPWKPRGLASWLAWSASMLFYHLPSRLLVVVGDLPNHDFHHRYPATPDWMIAAYGRQRDIDNGLNGGPPYSEVWGLGQAIDRMFLGMSQADAHQPGRARAEAILHASLDS
ncbi:MAG TPA: fatty acid desaturase [Acidobacteriota bacterium]|nr:fatty acid desaturase [Acidobacteriota bacterium]